MIKGLCHPFSRAEPKPEILTKCSPTPERVTRPVSKLTPITADSHKSLSPHKRAGGDASQSHTSVAEGLSTHDNHKPNTELVKKELLVAESKGLEVPKEQLKYLRASSGTASNSSSCKGDENANPKSLRLRTSSASGRLASKTSCKHSGTPFKGRRSPLKTQRSHVNSQGSGSMTRTRTSSATSTAGPVLRQRRSSNPGTSSHKNSSLTCSSSTSLLNTAGLDGKSTAYSNSTNLRRSVSSSLAR